MDIIPRLTFLKHLKSITFTQILYKHKFGGVKVKLLHDVTV